MTLTKFLLARIAEDERDARDMSEGAWEDACSATRRYGHVFRWSPERVLAECEAKRRIVELHGAGPHACEGREHSTWALPCETLGHLAAVHADHPDYREEWKP